MQHPREVINMPESHVFTTMQNLKNQICGSQRRENRNMCAKMPRTPEHFEGQENIETTTMPQLTSHNYLVGIIQGLHHLYCSFVHAPCHLEETDQKATQ
jgi:hypothetical protein